MRLHATRRAAIAQARGLGNPLWDLAGVPASLDLRFAESKSLVDAVSGQNLITFTRASDGAVVNSAGQIEIVAANVPRFTHDPVTLESLGLLVEEQRTNLLLRSEEFDNASWTLFGTASRSANATNAPNGSLTADSVTLPVAAGIYQLVSASASTSYTFSLWIRADSAQTVRLVINTNLSDPSVLTVTATTAWQRFSITKTTSAGTTSVTAQLDTGGGNTFYIWGAQLEVGAFPTSYIPTTATAVTRSADVASITGANFSSWYRQDEGTVFAECAVALPASGGNQFVFRASDNGFNNNTTINIQGGGFASMATAAGGVFDGAAASVLALTANVNQRFAGGYAIDNLGVSLSGGVVAVDTSATMPTTLNRLDIGSDHISTNRVRAGTIRRLTYWPARLSNGVLQTLTQ
jgi:hypothetical protein